MLTNQFRGQSRVRLDRKSLGALEENFKAFVLPLLDQNNPEDYHFIWEWQKFFHAKKLRVLTAESELVKRWKESLVAK